METFVNLLWTIFFLFTPSSLLLDCPAPPSNLTLFSVEPFTVSWVPPFTLPGVTLSYIVNVTNLNTSGDFSSDELRSPSFNFTGTGGSPCDIYQFMVTAKNAAGWSDPSNAFTASLPSRKLLDVPT